MMRSWTIRVLIGFSLLLSAVACQAEERREIRFPDVPGYHTLKADLHMHTVFSDGAVWPTVRVDEAWREGLDVISITDHIEYQPHKADLPTNHNRPYELARNKAAELGIVLIRGAEITRDTPPGHYNAVFLDDINPLDTPDFYDVFDAAAAQNAFVFWNHPTWKGREKGQWGEWQQKLHDKRQLHGIEVCNGDTYYRDAHRFSLEHNLTMIGTSDIHGPSRGLRAFGTGHRTLTLVFAKRRTVEAVQEALEARRTVVWYDNQLIGRAPELAALFQACVKVHAPHHSAGNQKWVRIENRCEVDLELQRVHEGDPARISIPAGTTTVARFCGMVWQDTPSLRYRVKNFLVGPDEPVEVELHIPSHAEVARRLQLAR